MTEELKKEIKEVVKETITDLLPEIENQLFEKVMKRQSDQIQEIYDNTRRMLRDGVLNINTINVGALNTNIKDGEKLMGDPQITS